jgi:hypothetical protein
MKKIYLGEIEQAGNDLINFSKNDINNKIEELKELPRKFVWETPTSNSYIEMYENMINKISNINNDLIKLAEFLLMADSDYSESNNKITKAYDDFIENFEEENK